MVMKPFIMNGVHAYVHGNKKELLSAAVSMLIPINLANRH